MNPAPELDAAVHGRLAALLERAAEQLRAQGHGPLPAPELRFFDHRLDAGRAVPPARCDAGGVIELNSIYLRDHTEAMLDETLPHELAHLLVFHLCGQRRLRRRDVRPHGPLWQRIMREWFEAEPERTHSFDAAGIRARRQRRWRYRCDCRTHALSTVRHRRAETGARYLCRACSAPLRAERDALGCVRAATAEEAKP